MKTEREPYTYPFTEEEMQEIEARGVSRQEKEAHQRSVTVIGWSSVPVWIFVLLVVFNGPLRQYEPWVAVCQVLFPAILLGGLTGKLLAKP